MLHARGERQVLRNYSASLEKEPWEQFLLPNPHTDSLKFYNGVVRQIYESAFCSKQAGFEQYLLEQQQMHWQLNTKIKDLSDREDNLLRNEKWGVCQNITKFIAGVDDMVARVAAMTLSSVSPNCPLWMTPWNRQQICYHSSTASEKSFIEKTILQNPLQAASWNIFKKLKNE